MVVPYLLDIRLARTIGYFLPVPKDPILTDWHEVDTSNFFRQFHKQKFNFYFFVTEITTQVKKEKW